MEYRIISEFFQNNIRGSSRSGRNETVLGAPSSEFQVAPSENYRRPALAYFVGGLHQEQDAVGKENSTGGEYEHSSLIGRMAAGVRREGHRVKVSPLNSKKAEPGG
jgi:hypothetical protein